MTGAPRKRSGGSGIAKGGQGGRAGKAGSHRKGAAKGSGGQRKQALEGRGSRVRDSGREGVTVGLGPGVRSCTRQG